MSWMPASLSRAHVVVVLCGWGLAVLLLSSLAVVSSAAGSQLPGSSDLGVDGWAVGFLAVSLQAFLLALWAGSSRFALVSVSAVVPVAAAFGLGIATDVTSVAVLIGAFAVMVDTGWPRCAPSLVAAVALVGGGDLVRAARDGDWTNGSVGAAALQGIGTVGLAAVVGAVVLSRREATRARLGRDVALAGEQVALTEAAVARERVAMARELHDIAAHHLSGIAVMTGALDRQIDSDPAGAKVAVRQVRRQSTAMLKDLRNLVALLREDGPRSTALDVEPESLSGIPALVETACRAGRDVALSVLGIDVAQISSIGVGPLAQLAAYRTVQESLANAARHAPGARCRVVIDVRESSEVVIEVRNDPAPPRAPASTSASSGSGGGFGILGMRERAELTDARLSAGPTPDGGWMVQLIISVDPVEDQL